MYTKQESKLYQLNFITFDFLLSLVFCALGVTLLLIDVFFSFLLLLQLSLRFKSTIVVQRCKSIETYKRTQFPADIVIRKAKNVRTSCAGIYFTIRFHR